MKELNKFRQFLNENEDDGYDKASRELFDMTWDEVRRENDPRMKQAVHDEVQKDDDTNYIDDVQESQSISQGFYEVDFIEMDGNEVTRDFRHFTDENEAKQMFNDLKTNPEIVKVTRNELFKGDGENYLGGSEEREYSVNKETDLHRIFLNSRLGDKRFEEPESIMQFFKRKNQAREEFLSSPELNEGSINESLEALMSKAKKIQSFVDKQGKEDGYEGGAHSPVGGVLAALKVAGGPGFDGDEKLKGFYTRKLSKAIDTQLQKKYMKGFLNEIEKPTIVVYDGKRLAVDPKDIERLKSGKDIVGKSTKNAGQEEWISAKGKWKVEESLNEFDDKSMKDYGDAMKVALGAQIRDAEEILDSGEADGMPLDNETEMLVRQELKRLKQMVGAKGIREETSLEEIYKDIMEVDKEEEKIRKEYDGMKRPSQDEVHDAFEKFNRETHYLNNKPVSKWDAADMSNWKSILSKGGKLFMSVKESMVRHRVSYTNKDSSKDSQDFIGGLNAEDEFYELMDNDEIISASLEMLRGDKMEVVDTWSRDENGKVSIKLGK